MLQSTFASDDYTPNNSLESTELLPNILESKSPEIKVVASFSMHSQPHESGNWDQKIFRQDLRTRSSVAQKERRTYINIDLPDEHYTTP